MRKVAQRKMLRALKVILPMLYLGMLVFIFSNSLQTGAQSSQTSSRVVDMVQAIFKAIAPNSKIATATGEDYLKLHQIIRVLAHFTEFAVLGGLVACCCLVYSAPKKYQYLAMVSTAIMPIIDETLQCFTVNRAAQFLDVCIDFCGGAVGLALVVGVYYLVRCHRNKKNPQNNPIKEEE